MEEHRPKSCWIKSVPVLSLPKGYHPPQILFLSHGGDLRRLDQALHLLSRRASPVRNGRSRGRGLSHRPASRNGAESAIARGTVTPGSVV